MVVIRKIEQIDPVTVRIELYIDSVDDLATTTIGIPTGMNIQAGSFAYDANGNIAIYNSSGEWNIVS